MNISISGNIVIFVEEGVILLKPTGDSYQAELGVIPYNQLTAEIAVKDGVVHTPSGPYSIGQAYFCQCTSFSPRSASRLRKHLTGSQWNAVEKARKAAKAAIERSEAGVSLRYPRETRSSVIAGGSYQQVYINNSKLKSFGPNHG